MRLDNAKELKAMLLTEGHKSIAEASRDLLLPPETQLFGNPRVAEARGASLEKAGSCFLPTYAVGIGTRQNGEHTVEVRVQTRGRIEGFLSTWFQKFISAAARREVNVANIGILDATPKLEKNDGAPWYQKETRPLRCGASVGLYKITAGTTGGFVKCGDKGTYILSNNHVLAAVNDAKKGDAILQPGPHDGGKVEEHEIAKLDRFIEVSTEKPNLVDCALGYVKPGIEYYPAAYEGIGKLKGHRSIDKSTDTVHKMGRTTGKTDGTIVTTDVDNVAVNMGRFIARFDQQVEIRGDFSAGGDSGSLIIDDDGYAVALLFAGSPGRTFGNTITNVIDALGIEFEL